MRVTNYFAPSERGHILKSTDARWVDEVNWKWGEICWCRTLHTSCALCNSESIEKIWGRISLTFFFFHQLWHPTTKRHLSTPPESHRIPVDIWLNLVHTKGSLITVSYIFTSLIQSPFQKPLTSLHYTIVNNICSKYHDIKNHTNLSTS